MSALDRAKAREWIERWDSEQELLSVSDLLDRLEECVTPDPVSPAGVDHLAAQAQERDLFAAKLARIEALPVEDYGDPYWVLRDIRSILRGKS